MTSRPIGHRVSCLCHACRQSNGVVNVNAPFYDLVIELDRLSRDEQRFRRAVRLEVERAARRSA